MRNNVLENQLTEASSTTTTRKEQGLEFAVFLFLIVPSMALSLFAIRQGQLSFVLAATATILRDLALVSLILFFLWRNREPLRLIGWTWRHPVPRRFWVWCAMSRSFSALRWWSGLCSG